VGPDSAVVRIQIVIDGYATRKEIFVFLIHFYLTTWNCVKTNISPCSYTLLKVNKILHKCDNNNKVRFYWIRYQDRWLEMNLTPGLIQFVPVPTLNAFD
jgi:hypothetical protein